jgi:arabinofuranosyltransferase
MDIKKVFIILFISSFTVLLFISLHKNQQDDAYIFYTYARNIADGNGYVFNPGEKINATTSPAYTLMLAGLYFISRGVVDVPFIGEIINAAGIWFSAFALYLLFMFFRKERLALLAPLFFLTNPLIKHGVGMESFLMLALALWGIYFYFKNKLVAASILLAFATLTRFDIVLLVIILFIWDIYKNRRLPQPLPVIVYIVIVLSWFVFSWYYFDSLMPTTVYIKVSQISTGIFGTGLIFIKGVLKIFPGGKIIALCFITALTAAAFFVFRRNRKIFLFPLFLIILSWGVLHFISYGFVLNTPPYPWYYIPYILVFTLIFTAAADEIYLLMNKRKTFLLIPAVIITVGLLLPVKLIFSPYYYKYELYTAAAEWLNENAEENSSVLMDEIGIVGFYYKKGKILDVFGLINPEAAEKLNQQNYNWTLRHFNPDYVLADYPNTHKYLNVHEEGLLPYKECTIINKDRGDVIIYKKSFSSLP